MDTIDSLIKQTNALQTRVNQINTIINVPAIHNAEIKRCSRKTKRVAASYT